MSTPDQAESPQFTRKQLRELRNTGATPIITDQPAAPAAAGTAPEAPGAVDPAAASAAPVQTITEVPAPAAHLPRAAEPVTVPPAPAPDASVDLGAAPLTRRQARQQERIRTASVPVITPDVIAAHNAATQAAAPVAPEPVSAPVEPPVHREQPDDGGLRIFEAAEPAAPDAASEGERAVVSPTLGAALLVGAGSKAELPPSFDQLLSRDTATSGSTAGPSTLIVSQASTDAPLVAPVASTGEVLVTGTFPLPEGLGSTGHAPGTTDGKDIDAVLIDGELPTHSSPTPIAASAAVSTVKTNDDLIRPPAPEKSSKLMLSLAITAGVLALALVGVLVFALATGVFK